MRAVFLTILLFSPLSWLSAQSEENRVEKAELELAGIESLTAGSFNISITYHFTEPLQSEIELKVLNFGIPVSNSVYFTKDAQGSVQRVSFQGKGRVMAGKISSFISAGLGNKLTVFYKVPLPDMNDNFDLKIPIVFPVIPSASNNAGLFQASLELPKTVNLYEQFPAQTWSVESTEKSNIHQLSLQAVPSVITIKGGTEPKPMFSMLRLVDGFIILLLIVLLILGWKKIKQV